MIEPFVVIWLGEDFVLSKAILVLAVSIYYLKGINSAIDVAKNAAGLFHPDRFVPMIEALINMGISIIMAYRYGITGVLIGTLISFVICSFWTKPYFVYRDVFEVEFHKYLMCEGQKIIVATVLAAVLYWVQGFISFESLILTFLVKAVFVGVASNGLLFIIYCKADEFAYVKALGETLLSRIIMPKKICK